MLHGPAYEVELGNPVLLQGAVVDSLQVNFTLNATVYDAAPTQSDISGEVTGVGNSTTTTKSCETTCPNIFNVTCLVKHLCWNRLGKLAIIVLGIMAGGAPSATHADSRISTSSPVEG